MPVVEQWKDLVVKEWEKSRDGIIFPGTMLAVIHQQSRGNTLLVRENRFGLTQIHCADALHRGLRTCASLLNAPTNIRFAQKTLSQAAREAGATQGFPTTTTMVGVWGARVINGIANYYGLTTSEKSELIQLRNLYEKII